jgi:hypothetical protein
MVWLVRLSDGKTRLSVAGGIIPDNLASTPAYTLEDIICKLEADITYNETIANKPDTFLDQPLEITPWECAYERLVGLATLERTLCCGISWGKTPMEAAFKALKEVQECFPDKIKRL